VPEKLPTLSTLITMNWKDVVFMALDGPNYTWRTTSAIARQTGLPEAKVISTLAKYNMQPTRISEVPSISGAALVGLLEKVG
jgi:hypothetical protein